MKKKNNKTNNRINRNSKDDKTNSRRDRNSKDDKINSKGILKSSNQKGIKWRVVVYSIIGLFCIALAFLVDWMFLIGTVICIFLNQKELNKKR